MEYRDIDIIKNMKTIDWLKSELLNNVALLHSTLVSGEENTKQDLEDVISNIILQSYILGKRLGIDYNDINNALVENIKLNLIEEHKIERWYGDLSSLMEFLQFNKRKQRWIYE